MTFHIKKLDYPCSACGAVFVPFRRGTPCPKCEAPSGEVPEYHDFIEKLAASMRAQKYSSGHFTPDAWYTGSLAEHVQLDCFRTFDALEEEQPANERNWLINLIEEETSKEYYLKNNIRDILLAVYEIYKDENRFIPPPPLPTPKQQLLRKIKNYMARKMHPKRYFEVQLPWHLNQWFNREVYAMHGELNTVEIIDESDYSTLKKKAREHLQAQVPQTPGLADILLSDAVSCTINSKGMLYLPKAFERHLGTLGRLKIKILPDNKLILQKGAADLKRSFLAALREEKALGESAH